MKLNLFIVDIFITFTFMKFKKSTISLIMLALISIILFTGSPFQITNDLVSNNGSLSVKNIGQIVYAQEMAEMMAVEAMTQMIREIQTMGAKKKVTMVERKSRVTKRNQMIQVKNMSQAVKMKFMKIQNQTHKKTTMKTILITLMNKMS